MSAHLRTTPFWILLCLVLGGFHILPAQEIPTCTLSGRVVDDSTGAPLSKVNVFIANSTMGSATDDQGGFRIRNVPVGAHEIIASIVGYSVNSRFIRLTDQPLHTIEIRLKSKVIELGPVDIVAGDPVEWRKDLSTFTGYFFGKSPNADKCKILNPEVLSFSKDWSGTFEARASESLRVENLALGYDLDLQLLTFNVGGKWLSYAWRALFREIASTDDERRDEWRKNRIRSYRGSLRHFFASLVEQTAAKQGFSMYIVRNPRMGASRVRWSVTEEEITAPGSSPNEKILRFQDYLEVEFETGPATVWRTPRGVAETSSSDISWVELAHEFATINSMGEYVEPYSLQVTGVWAKQRVADALPHDFHPSKK